MPDFEIADRRGELQVKWLRAHYDEQTLREALVAIVEGGQRPFPFNVARRLAAAGGKKMPKLEVLIAADDSTRRAEAETERIRAEGRARREAILAGPTAQAWLASSQGRLWLLCTTEGKAWAQQQRKK